MILDICHYLLTLLHILQLNVIKRVSLFLFLKDELVGFKYFYIPFIYTVNLIRSHTHTHTHTHTHIYMMCSSVAHSSSTVCNPIDCSTPGLPVHHQLLEFTQAHVHRVSDVIQPSHPLNSM